MNIFQKIEIYGDTHHPKWLDLLRILLGLIIFHKAIVFITDTSAIVKTIEGSFSPWIALWIAHYIAGAHLFGGILIAIGLLTRVAIVFQIPILLGAVLINAPNGFFSLTGEWQLSLLVLFLLIFFLIYGSGPWSVDELIQKKHDPLQ